MTEYAGNSKKQKEEMKREKVIKQVAKGKVQTRKETKFGSLVSKFIVNDLRTVSEYVIKDILIPSAKRTLGEMLNNGYAKTPSERTGRYRTQLQVSECILICTQFVDNLLKDGVKLAAKKKELWKKEEKLERQGGQIHSYQKKTAIIPNFHVTCFSEDKQPIFRDIPNEVLQRMFQLAFRYMPHLVMPMALGAFAGLRPGECCQVQQEFAGGFQCQYVAGKLHAVTFDLTRNRQLRGDGVSTGSIKRRRKQKVYPGFLEPFQRILQFQKRYLEQIGFEPEFAPLVVNSRGVAMTTAAYSSAFQKLVEAYFSPAAKRFIEEWRPIKEALGHKPFRPDSDEYKEFMNKTMLKVKALSKKYPKFVP